MLQWQGQTVSRVGSQLFSAAMVFWIKRTTGSASIIGLISLVAGLPGVLLIPIGGVVADRYSRRKIMIISDLLRGLALLVGNLASVSSPECDAGYSHQHLCFCRAQRDRECLFRSR